MNYVSLICKQTYGQFLFPKPGTAAQSRQDAFTHHHHTNKIPGAAFVRMYQAMGPLTSQAQVHAHVHLSQLQEPQKQHQHFLIQLCSSSWP